MSYPAVIRLELRRGTAIWFVVPLVVLGIVSAVHAQPPGQPAWSYVVSSLGQAGQNMAPLAAAVAAFVGGRSSRRKLGALEMTSVRGEWMAASAELAALLSATLAAYLLVVLVLFTDAARGGADGSPDIGRTIAGAVGVMAIAVVWFVVGRAIGRRLVPLLAAAATYVVINYVNSSQGGLRYTLFLPTNLNLSDFYDRVNRTVAPAQLAWYVGLSALIWLAWVLRRMNGFTRLTTSALVVALALASGGGLVLQEQHGQANQPGVHVTFVCAGRTFSLCLNPATTDARQALTREFLPIVVRLQGTPFALTRIEQRPRGLGSSPSPGAAGFGLDNTGPAAIRQAAVELVGNAISGRCIFGPNGEPPTGADAQGIVTAWAGGLENSYGSPFPAVEKAARVFFALNDAVARTVVNRHGAKLTNCTLTVAGLSS